MPLGQATQETTYNKSADETLSDIQEALKMIGKVDNVNHANLTIEGSSKYGFQTVNLRVKIIPQGETTIISINGFGDDIRAVGAKKCMARLLETMDNLGNPDYKPSRTGIKPFNMVLMLIGVILCVLIGIAVIGFSGSYLLRAAIFLVGLVLIIYFVSARKRFISKK
jgi:hypothetical protein